MAERWKRPLFEILALQPAEFAVALWEHQQRAMAEARLAGPTRESWMQ